MTTPRRILHVIPSLAPRDGGPTAAVLGMCRALGAAGTSTLIVATDADGPRRLDVVNGREGLHDGLPVIFFPRQMSESFKWSRPLEAWLDGHVNEFDLVHVHAVFSHASLAAGRACRRRAVPYIVRPLGTLDPWSLARHAYRKKILLRLGARQLLSGASALHYTSDGERRLAGEGLHWLPGGVVVPLGVDERLFEAAPEHRIEDRPFVLSLSRLDAKKGIDLLIGAFHGLAGDAACRAWRLVIAGDGKPKYVAALRQLAKAGPARDQIEFRGWVGDVERQALLGEAQLFALPSHQENFGIAMVEAMAAGVPVVVSAGVNLSEEIEGGAAGWVVERRVDALEGVLRHAMGDGGERRMRGDAARRLAEQFRWSRVAGHLQAVYSDLLQGRAGVAVRRTADPEAQTRPAARSVVS